MSAWLLTIQWSWTNFIWGARKQVSEKMFLFLLFGRSSSLIWYISAVSGIKMKNGLLGSFCGNHYSHKTPAPTTTNTHITQLYWLTIHKRSVLILTTTLWVTIAPSAIQSHCRQGQPATQSHPSVALIITLGPLQRESGSPGPEIVARKRL